MGFRPPTHHAVRSPDPALDHRKAERPVYHDSDWLDGCLQVVALPVGRKLSVVRCEVIGTQLVLVLEAVPFTFVVIWIADPARPVALGIGPYHCDVEYFCHVAWAQIQIALERIQGALIFLKPALASVKNHHLVFRTLELRLFWL
jgi:hypothetical protein